MNVTQRSVFIPFSDDNVTNGYTSNLSSIYWHSVHESGEDKIMEKLDQGFVSSILLAFCLLFVLIFSALGNAVVILAIVTDYHLRHAQNYFYASLAFADALVAILVMSFAIANDVLGYWMFGPVLCNVWLSCDVMFCTSSILHLCAISLDRYVHIHSPYHYERIVTSTKILMSIGAVWLVSALVSFVPIHLGWHKPPNNNAPSGVPQNDNGEVDDKEHCQMTLSAAYAICSSIVSFYAPCCLMLVLYTRLYRHAQRHHKLIEQTRLHVTNVKTVSPVPTSVDLTPTQGKGGEGSRNAAFNGLRRMSQRRIGAGGGKSRPQQGCGSGSSEHKAARTLGIIMGVFLLSWLPFFTLNIVSSLCPQQGCLPPAALVVSTWLGYANSSLNPLIYPVFNTEFRAAFRRLLQPLCVSCSCISTARSSSGDSSSCRPSQPRHASSQYDYGALSTTPTAPPSNTRRSTPEMITSL
jgi:dopamine receptor D1